MSPDPSTTNDAPSWDSNAPLCGSQQLKVPMSNASNPKHQRRKRHQTRISFTNSLEKPTKHLQKNRSYLLRAVEPGNDILNSSRGRQTSRLLRSGSLPAHENLRITSDTALVCSCHLLSAFSATGSRTSGTAPPFCCMSRIFNTLHTHEHFNPLTMYTIISSRQFHQY